MWQTSINSSSQSPAIKPGSRSLSKPPVPPKPLLGNKTKSLSISKQDLESLGKNAKFLQYEQKAPLSRSFIKGESFPPPSETIQAQESLQMISLPTMVQNDSVNSHRKFSSQGSIGLPQLVKSEANITLSSPKSKPYGSSGRTLSASAKNALLMQKLSGNGIDLHNDVNTEHSSLSNQFAVTVNRSVISINDFSDNANNNSSSKAPQKLTNFVIIDGPDETPDETLNNIHYGNSTLNHMSNNSSKTIPEESTIHKQFKASLSKNSEPLTPHPEVNQHECQSPERLKSLKHIDSLDLSRQKFIQNLEEIYAKEQLNGNKFDEPAIDEVDSYCDKRTLDRSLMNLQLGCSQSAPCSPAAKPTLQKSQAIDLDDPEYYKKLSRGISRATDNINIVSKARTELAQGIWVALESRSFLAKSPFFVETPIFTFTLPDLSVYSDEFRTFLEKDLIEMSTLVSLEAVDRLNWWAIIGASQRLWPLATTGDGNCLLHAASLGMWGFHDRLLTLRKALFEFLSHSQYSRPLWRRWRWQLAMQNRKTGLVYNQEEWEAEWANVIRLASSTPRGEKDPSATTGSAPDLTQNHDSLSQGKLDADCSGQVYESLEEIHVLALSHILRRPIIVVADTTLKDVNGAPFAPIPFGGIYLPLECPPKECQRSPLLLTYDAAHFSALVVMESQEKHEPELPAVIPVTDCHHDLLPIQFLVDPGEDFTWGQDEHDPLFIKKLTITIQDKKGLLNEYLDLIEVPIPSTYLEAAAAYVASEDSESPENYYSDYLDFEKKSSESSFDSDDGPPYADTGMIPPKAKASKQLQTVVKQFGSIGRSMSRRIKKNLNSLSRLSRTGSFRKKELLIRGGYGKNKMVHVSTVQNFILSAHIHTDKRFAYQEEMINNYLNTARQRFNQKSSHQQIYAETYKPKPNESLENLAQCINAGCKLYGTAETSYMCSNCFARQKEEEEKEYSRQSSSGSSNDGHVSKVNGPQCIDGKCKTNGPQYGAGKSKFYAELDENSVKNASRIPITRSLSNVKDKTLFLSNSTFYNDSSSIPSYNLRGAKLQSMPGHGVQPTYNESESGGSTNDVSVIPGSTNVGHLKVGVKKPLQETLVPVCIDDVRIQLSNRLANRVKDSGVTIENGSPMSCLTDGCEFYGNPSTEGLCSKCHLAKKKKSSSKLDAYSVDQINYVHI